ncbi:MAG TPA: GAF domain-containing protein [Allosphingosinicella sp.]
MKDAFAQEVARQGDDEEVKAILDEICALTGMGFAAVARVTEERWIAAQVLDKVEFGLRPGDELEIKKTICQEIRDSGEAVVIDHIGADAAWRTHPVPMLYGFESYASLPVFLTDGSFYGTLCAIDSAPRALSAPDTIAALQRCAGRVAEILTERTARRP